MNLVDELLHLIASLEDAQVEYAICGGIALAIHGCPRFTQDIDLLVRGVDLEGIRDAARTRGFTLEDGRPKFGAGTDKEREVLRLSKADAGSLLTLDLLIVAPSLQAVWDSRQRVEWRGLKVWIVSREGLVRMKRLAGRAQDLVDVDRLLQTRPEHDHE